MRQDNIVPDQARPVLWKTGDPISANLLKVNAWIAHYQDRLPDDTFIDEASILVPDMGSFDDVNQYLEKAGWSHFNASEDLVYTNPFGTKYGVAYDFFRHPDYGYRIELMQLTGEGMSPLHEALQALPKTGYDGYPMPHLSFKPVLPVHTSVLTGESLVSQKRRSYSRAVQHLRDRACIHAMTCQSAYGNFGYFLGNDTSRQIYVKPRINLRDEVVGE